jgi:hypothetical protein
MIRIASSSAHNKKREINRKNIEYYNSILDMESRGWGKEKKKLKSSRKYA